MARRRPRGDGSIDRMRDGRWRGRLTVDGSRVAKYGKTQAEVREKLDELKQQRKAGILITGRSPSLAEYVQEWLEGSDAKPVTLDHYRRLWRNHIEPSDLPRMQINKVRTRHADLLLSKLKKKGVGGRTRQHVRQVLFSVFRRAKKKQLIMSNPIEDVDVPVAKKKRPVNFSREEINTLLEAASVDEMTHPLFVLACATAMREGELFVMQWHRIDLDAGRVDVVATLYRPPGGSWEITEPKTENATRTLDIGPNTVAVLRQHKARLQAAGLFDPSGFVFPTSRKPGGKVQPHFRSNFSRRVWKRVLKRADFNRLEARNAKFHHIRHSIGSIMLSNLTPLPAVSKQLGHASPQITAAIYSHELAEDRRAAVLELDEQLVASASETKLALVG